MTEARNSPKYDLEDRTLKYAKDVISLINGVPKSITNAEITKQLIRSAGSVGANYIEANGALGKKDLSMRIRICRKEAKESKYWLTLVTVNNDDLEVAKQTLIKETDELLRIFNAILSKVII